MLRPTGELYRDDLLTTTEDASGALRGCCIGHNLSVPANEGVVWLLPTPCLAALPVLTAEGYTSQALDRPEPPAFPLNAALLPACRQRVKLAVRLDAILREQSKAHAGVSLRTLPCPRI